MCESGAKNKSWLTSLFWPIWSLSSFIPPAMKLRGQSANDSQRKKNKSEKLWGYTLQAPSCTTALPRWTPNLWQQQRNDNTPGWVLFHFTDSKWTVHLTKWWILAQQVISDFSGSGKNQLLCWNINIILFALCPLGPECDVFLFLKVFKVTINHEVINDHWRICSLEDLVCLIEANRKSLKPICCGNQTV